MLRRNITVKPKKKKKGQSTTEYIVLVAGVLAVMFFFLRPNGPFQNAYNRTLSFGTNGMEDMANRLQDSHGPF